MRPTSTADNLQILSGTSSEEDPPNSESGPVDAAAVSGDDRSPMSDPKHGTRLLYIEDDPGLARLFQRRMSHEGYEVQIAANAEEGLSLCAAGWPEMVATDYKLPDRDGLEVLARIAASGEHPPPVILITGAGDEKVAAEAMRQGARDYVVKDAEGLYLDLLPSVIEQALAWRRLTRAKHDTEQALRRSEARLLEAQRIARLGNWEWELNSDRVTWSNEIFRIFGLEPGSVEPARSLIYACIHPQDVAAVEAATENALATTERCVFDYRVLRPDRSIRYVQERAEVVCDSSGRPLRLIGTLQDITERKTSELALLQEKERAQVTLSSICDAVITTDAQGLIEYLNPVSAS